MKQTLTADNVGFPRDKGMDFSMFKETQQTITPDMFKAQIIDSKNYIVLKSEQFKDFVGDVKQSIVDAPEQESDIIKAFNDDISGMVVMRVGEEQYFVKAKTGVGSKGGKVIGYTKSGKPIYDSANHESHKNFTYQDHQDAAKLNKTNAKNSKDSEAHYTSGAAKHGVGVKDDKGFDHNKRLNELASESKQSASTSRANAKIHHAASKNAPNEDGGKFSHTDFSDVHWGAKHEETYGKNYQHKEGESHKNYEEKKKNGITAGPSASSSSAGEHKKALVELNKQVDKLRSEGKTVHVHHYEGGRNGDADYSSGHHTYTMVEDNKNKKAKVEKAIDNDLEKSHISDAFLYSDNFKFEKTGKEIKDQIDIVVAQETAEAIAAKTAAEAQLKLIDDEYDCKPTQQLSEYAFRGYKRKIDFDMKRFDWRECQYNTDSDMKFGTPLGGSYVQSIKTCGSKEESEAKYKYNELVDKYLDSLVEIEVIKTIKGGLNDKEKYQLNQRQLTALNF